MSENAKAVPFEEMAARIERLAAGDFSGAVVLVPPGDGEALVMLNVDPSQNAAHFWNAAKARIEVAYAEFAEAQRVGDPWGRRR